MRFLAGEQLHDAVRRVLQSPEVRCAVAFWGNGAEADDLIVDATTAKIVCNLRMGGTNPRVIRALQKRGAKVQQLDQLHAKVYLGSETAVVSSANASANGLALEGLEQAHWSEAGIEISCSDAGDISGWFDQIWRQSQPISPSDLRHAEALWKARRRSKPTVSFADYDVEAEAHDGTLPITFWWTDHVAYAPDEEATQNALGFYREGMFAFELEDENDVPVIKPGTWLLFWKRGANGTPRRDKLKFGQAGNYVPGVMRNLADETPNVGALLAVDEPRPQPFDPSEPRFEQAFREVIVRPQFDVFRSPDGPPWFTILAPHLLKFWRQVAKRYHELPS